MRGANDYRFVGIGIKQAKTEECAKKAKDDQKKSEECLTKADGEEAKTEGIRFEQDDKGTWYWIAFVKKGDKETISKEGAVQDRQRGTRSADS